MGAKVAPGLFKYISGQTQRANLPTSIDNTIQRRHQKNHISSTYFRVGMGDIERSMNMLIIAQLNITKVYTCAISPKEQ